MNFRRIMWTFLIAFIILDFFLLYSFTQQDNGNDFTNSTVANKKLAVLKNIKDDQISIGKQSDDSDFGYYISGLKSNDLKRKANQLENVSFEYSEDKINVKFDNPIKIDRKNEKKFFDILVVNPKLVVEGQKYIYSSEYSDKNHVVYAQTTHGKPIYSKDAEIIFDVKNDYVLGYSQGYLKSIQNLREKKETISGQRALIWLYQYNKIPSNSVIEWQRLGYTKLLSVNNNVIYIPTWNFYIKNKSSENYTYRRINAFSGAMMEEH